MVDPTVNVDTMFIVFVEIVDPIKEEKLPLFTFNEETDALETVRDDPKSVE